MLIEEVKKILNLNFFHNDFASSVSFPPRSTGAIDSFALLKNAVERPIRCTGSF